jgi:hypothetical protein
MVPVGYNLPSAVGSKTVLVLALELRVASWAERLLVRSSQASLWVLCRRLLRPAVGQVVIIPPG